MLDKTLRPREKAKKGTGGEANYKSFGLHRYKEEGVVMKLDTEIEGFVAIGAETEISNRALIKNSTIGRKCFIGEGAIVIDSFIWSGVNIGAGARIESSIVCDNVQIGPGAVVGAGSMISFFVEVKSGATLPPRTIASRYTYNEGAKKFEETKHPHEEFFEKGTFSYIPKDSRLREDEYVGAARLTSENEKESDIEEDESSSEDEKEQTQKEEGKNFLLRRSFPSGGARYD